MATAIFQFGEYRLDRERFELSRTGHAVKLERKPMELLILLAESQGNLVGRAEIAERLWGGAVFVDTEHGINTAVRKIRQALRDDPEEPRFLHTVMGKGYRFVCEPVESHAQAIEGIAAAVPETAVADGPAQELSGRKRPRNWRWRMALLSIAIGLVPAAVLTGQWKMRRQAQAAAVNISSLAVLPLDNLSGDPGQEYFADGMTDELITQIAKNSTLRVISRTSVMQYKGAHRPLPQIARALGVEGILEGSISRAGDRVHMTIQLIHAADDSDLWAESYDRDANEAVLLPRDASIAIATKLKSVVAQPAPRPVNPAAHDAYLRGEAFFFTNPEASQAYFKKATELQPDYSLGWSGLAKYYGDGADGGSLRPQEAIPLSRVAGLKAVALDDSSAEAHMALAGAYWLSCSWEPALRESARSIELGPRISDTYQVRAMLLLTLNRDQEAIEVEKKSLEVDPFARPYGLVMMYIQARQFDAAIAEAKQRLEYLPNSNGLYWQLAAAYEAKGMYKEEEAAVMKEAALESNLVDTERLHRIYLQGGHWALVRQKLRDAEKSAADKAHYVSPYWQADLHAQLGHREEALAFLEAAYRERSPLLLWIQHAQEFDFLHGEERYRAIVKGMGLPPAY